VNADYKATHVSGELVHGAPLIACRFDPKGRFLFAASENRLVSRFELATGKRADFAGHASWPMSIAFSPDGETVLTGGCDDTVAWWPAAAEKPEPVRKVKAHEGWVRALAVSPDGKLVASAGPDKVVRLWELADGKPVREMAGHEKDVYSLVFHPSGEFLVSGDLIGSVRQWEVATGKAVRTIDAKPLHSYNEGQGVDFGGVRSLSFSPDAKQLSCSGLHKASNPLGAVNEPLVLRIDWESGKTVKQHVGPLSKGVAWRALFHPEGFIVGCSGGGDGAYILFWDAEPEKASHMLKLPDTARDLDLHPDGVTLATAHYDGKVRLSRMAPKAK
jgi:WD40 repeat protein